MSLAKRNNGCLECRTRRVICDKAEPECFKCRKKGIKCSGQGIECRFSPYMRKNSNATSGKVRTTASKLSDAPLKIETTDTAAKPGTSTNTATDSPPRATSSKQYQWVDSIAAPSPKPAPAVILPKVEDDADADAAELLDTPQHSSSPTSSSSSQSDDTYNLYNKGKAPLSPLYTTRSSHSNSLVVRRPSGKSQPWVYTPRPGTTIESVSSDSRFYFDHFSNFIASKMVVLDFSANGYRQIILPLATQDPMVSQAVGVVSAFHLSQAVPSLRMDAEVNQQRILSKLRESALLSNPDQFFKLSTWVTILVLLVGDTITGSTNYVYLLDLLSQLSNAALSDESLPESVKQFVNQQTQMFVLFGSPLSSEKKGLQMLQKRPADYLSFMSYCPPNPEQHSNLLVMTEIITQACTLFQNRALKIVTPESSIASVERMRQTVMTIDPNAAGSHSLVWPFFIAAAESSLQEHRDFFSGRLKHLFSFTRFGSIPVALDTLQYIWSKSDTKSWTDIVTNERQVLIM